MNRVLQRGGKRVSVCKSVLHTFYGKVVLITLSSVFSFSGLAIAQYSVAGKVINQQTNAPIEFAVVTVPEARLWAVADANGEFSFLHVPARKIAIVIQHLGFAKGMFAFDIHGDTTGLVLPLTEQNLMLQEVVITAQKNTGLTTSYNMDRTVLDHQQILNVTDATSLLPGGKTNTALHLATAASQSFAVNGYSGEMGHPLFGVAVEVDGIRLSNNAIPVTDPNVHFTPAAVTGTDTRNIASSNIESIEIITGIPSVEHGDLSNGMVRITTRRGQSPFIVDMATKPNTKQIALSKGFSFGPESGVLNINLEHTKSISDLTSPYTSYARNGLSFNYTNTFYEKINQPLMLDVSLAGNLGGYNSKSDPDLFVNTYAKMKDNAFRTQASLRWLLNKTWITNIEASGAVNFNSRVSEVSEATSASSSVAAIHATEAGYHVGQTYEQNPAANVILIPPGYWYERSFDDNRLLNYSAKLKANWAHQFGTVNNNLLAGLEFSSSANKGRGMYYDDMRYAPTWRPYRYDQISPTHNYSLYAEDMITVPVNESQLQMVGGVRTDITAISGSAYGTITNLSPRVNAKYIFWEKAKRTVEELNVKIGWGKAVKLPAFSVLYPEPDYRDVLSFAPGTTADGSTYYAYYSMPNTRIHNPNLKWQYNIQHELSINATVSGVVLSLIAAQDQTFNAYHSINVYTPFTYKFTSQADLEGSAIPIQNRSYHVDQHTGIVTVSDNTGTLPSETLSYKEITRGVANTQAVNRSPVMRRRLSWIVQFKPIPAIKTSFRIDGHYYTYKDINQTLQPYLPQSTVMTADGSPYQYIGFFTGGASSGNGSMSRALNMNVTAITHIPLLKLIVSIRLEGSLYHYDRNLSEYGNGAQRGFVLNNKDEYVPAEGDIYAGDQFVGLYPEYYVRLDDMNTPIPFREKFLWAKENDPVLYNDLAKMVVKSNHDYYFNKNTVSAYYSANISVTKEIGRIASVSFNATNFFNNMALVHTSRNNGSYSLFGSSDIPSFYYGLSLRLKL